MLENDRMKSFIFYFMYFHLFFKLNKVNATEKISIRFVVYIHDLESLNRHLSKVQPLYLILCFTVMKEVRSNY